MTENFSEYRVRYMKLFEISLPLEWDTIIIIILVKFELNL